MSKLIFHQEQTWEQISLFICYQKMTSQDLQRWQVNIFKLERWWSLRCKKCPIFLFAEIKTSSLLPKNLANNGLYSERLLMFVVPTAHLLQYILWPWLKGCTFPQSSCIIMFYQQVIKTETAVTMPQLRHDLSLQQQTLGSYMGTGASQ